MCKRKVKSTKVVQQPFSLQDQNHIWAYDCHLWNRKNKFLIGQGHWHLMTWPSADSKSFPYLKIDNLIIIYDCWRHYVHHGHNVWTIQFQYGKEAFIYGAYKCSVFIEYFRVCTHEDQNSWAHKSFRLNINVVLSIRTKWIPPKISMRLWWANKIFAGLIFYRKYKSRTAVLEKRRRMY